MVFSRRLDVHHRLAVGCHNQDTQADRSRVQHRGPGATKQPAVWRKDLQRTRTADRLFASVLDRVQLRWLPKALFRAAIQQVVDVVAPGAVRLSVRREGRLGRQDVRGRPERRTAGDGLPKHVGLYVQQYAVHTQGLGVRRRRRLSR